MKLTDPIDRPSNNNRVWLPVNPRMENAHGTGESPTVTPVAYCAASITPRMPRSCMVCWVITSTLAGISRNVRPRRELPLLCSCNPSVPVPSG